MCVTVSAVQSLTLSFLYLVCFFTTYFLFFLLVADNILPSFLPPLHFSSFFFFPSVISFFLPSVFCFFSHYFLPYFLSFLIFFLPSRVHLFLFLSFLPTSRLSSTFFLIFLSLSIFHFSISHFSSPFLLFLISSISLHVSFTLLTLSILPKFVLILSASFLNGQVASRF